MMLARAGGAVACKKCVTCWRAATTWTRRRTRTGAKAASPQRWTTASRFARQRVQQLQAEHGEGARAQEQLPALTIG